MYCFFGFWYDAGMEQNNNALIIWLIVFGIALILGVAGAAYFLSAPSAPIIASNGSSSATTQSASGNNAADGARWEKGHYANIFYEFDYPNIFKITHESVTSDHLSDANGKDQFGVTQVTLSGTGGASTGGYEITVTTSPNDKMMAPEQLIADAKGTFFANTNHGQGDAFQQVSIAGKDAYKIYSQNTIIIGIPTGNLIHELRIAWIGTTGSADAANEYISALTESYTLK